MSKQHNDVTHDQHYKPSELAKRWGVSHDTVLRIFKNEPGVLRLVGPRNTGLRIPHKIAERVHRRLDGRAEAS